jgi:hypothetical protein
MLTKSKLRAAGLLTVLALTGAAVSVFGGATSTGANAHPTSASPNVNVRPANGERTSSGAYWKALKANAHPHEAPPYEGPH